MVVKTGPSRRQSTKELMLCNCGAGEDSWESLGQQGRSNQSILKEINLEYSLEGLMLKLQYTGHLMQTANSLEIDAGKDQRQKEKATEDEMVGWHHWFNGHELGQTPGDGGGREGLVCCSPWGPRESDTPWQLNNNNIQQFKKLRLISILMTWHRKKPTIAH